ncbi:hypothetical protein [uncultured Bdellovibrio sp.]|uniref:hypothetical protein n=1 Tax=Bdellovibrio sp. HCB-162 TaxID=3394234 RepID=UPI0025FE935A|nr:hypothetical protein [uncultured Bdellovibrio sp.]
MFSLAWIVNTLPAGNWICGIFTLLGVYLFVDACRSRSALRLTETEIIVAEKDIPKIYKYSDIVTLEVSDFSLGLKIVFNDGTKFLVNTKLQRASDNQTFPNSLENSRGRGVTQALFLIDDILKQKTGKNSGL